VTRTGYADGMADRIPEEDDPHGRDETTWREGFELELEEEGRSEEGAQVGDEMP